MVSLLVFASSSLGGKRRVGSRQAGTIILLPACRKYFFEHHSRREKILRVEVGACVALAWLGGLGWLGVVSLGSALAWWEGERRWSYRIIKAIIDHPIECVRPCAENVSIVFKSHKRRLGFNVLFFVSARVGIGIGARVSACYVPC